MSVERARKALAGKNTDYIPIFDLPNHREYLKQEIGVDPYDSTEEAVVRAVRKLDIDMLMCSVPEQSKREDNKTNLYGLDPTQWRHHGSTVTDIFSYNPLRDRMAEKFFGARAPSLSEVECIEGFQADLDRNRRLVGDTALTVGYIFTTCIHYAAEDLDWEEFLISCLTEEEKVSKLLDKFQAASDKLMRSWAATNLEVMLCHDDIAISKGTTLNAAWIRKHLIPRYKELFKPIKDKGVPLLFMTDGNFTAVARDLVEAGADGFFLDTPCIGLEKLVSVCGPDLIYFTGPSPAVMTIGSPDDVKTEVKRIADFAHSLPRFFFHLPGGYAHNMPVENVKTFYEACRKYGKR